MVAGLELRKALSQMSLEVWMLVGRVWRYPSVSRSKSEIGRISHVLVVVELKEK